MLIEEKGAYHLERATMISKLASNGEIRDYMQVRNNSVLTPLFGLSISTKQTKDIAESYRTARD